jgi:hypothetical protein
MDRSSDISNQLPVNPTANNHQRQVPVEWASQEMADFYGELELASRQCAELRGRIFQHDNAVQEFSQEDRQLDRLLTILLAISIIIFLGVALGQGRDIFFTGAKK